MVSNILGASVLIPIKYVYPNIYTRSIMSRHILLPGLIGAHITHLHCTIEFAGFLVLTLYLL